jgi:hypothetical protein
MAWLRDFRVTVAEGQRPEDIAGPPLAEIIGVLEAALARTGGHGPRAGDVLAHLGWAHWLNRHIAQNEFGDAAERTMRQALAVDPDNVFAHAMLGNWLLQTHGDVAEALRHFDAAEKTQKERALVRQMELGGLLSREDPAIPPALMRALNQMRKNGEPITDRIRWRALAYFRPGNREEVRAMLTAVPAREAWETFEWLDRRSPEDDSRYEGFRREYIHALVLEIEGKREEAAALLAALTEKMRAARFSGRLEGDVADAWKRMRAAGR